MMEFIEGTDSADEFFEAAEAELGGSLEWMDDDEIVDKLADEVAVLEQRLAEPASKMRFIQAVEGALTLRTVTAEMDAMRAENAELKRRVQQLEAEAKPEGASSSSGR